MSDQSSDIVLRPGSQEPLLATIDAEEGQTATILSATFQAWLLPSGEVLKPPLGTVDFTNPVPASGFDTQANDEVRAWYVFSVGNGLPEADYEGLFLVTVLGSDGVTRVKAVKVLFSISSIP